MSKLYLVQSALISEAERNDKADTETWETIVSGETAEEALEEFCTFINDGMLDDVNRWVRVLIK